MEVKYLVQNGVQFIEITNNIGFKVVLSSLGASIYSISYHDDVLTLSPENKKDFLKGNIYHGKTIGPIANRIKNGLVSVNNKEFKFDLNEGENTLHSGRFGLSNQIFGVKRYIKDDSVMIVYSFTKEKSKVGVPGKIVFVIAYCLKDNETTLSVNMRASSDEDTVVALTNHCFFTLGESNLDDLSLLLNSNRYIHPNERDLLPVEERGIIPCLDFNSLKPLMKDINDPYLMNSKTKGIDHHFVLDSMPIVLEGNKYRLEIKSDFSGVQIYTDNYSDDVKMINTDREQNRGVAIEPQDSTLDRKILKANEFYERNIEYKFIIK